MKFDIKVLSSVLITSAVMALPAVAQTANTQFAVPVPPALEVSSPDAGDAFDIAIAPPETFAIAFGPGGMGGAHCGLLSGLNLTDEQMEKLVSLNDKKWAAIASKTADEKALKHQLMDVLTAPQVDRKQASDLHKKLASVKEELCDADFNFMMDAADVLTEEQRKTVKHMMLSRQLMIMGAWSGAGNAKFGHHHFHH